MVFSYLLAMSAMLLRWIFILILAWNIARLMAVIGLPAVL